LTKIKGATLSKLILIEPTGRRITDPSLHAVRQVILSPPAGCWYETIGVAIWGHIGPLQVQSVESRSS